MRTELVARLAHRRERDGGGRGELDVVVADDGQVLGHPSAERTHCWSRPSATRSLAQNAAVGRMSRRQAGEPLTGAASLGDGQSAAVDDRAGRSAGTPAFSTRPARAPAQPVADLADALRAADEGDPRWPAVEEVLDREPTAEHVVDRDRAVRRARPGAVHDDHGRAAGRTVVERRVVGVDRGDQHALHALLLEAAEVAGLAGGSGCRCCRVNSERSAASAAASMPWATSVKNGLRGVEHDVGDGAARAAPGAGGPTRCGRTPGRPSRARPAPGSPG